MPAPPQAELVTRAAVRHGSILGGGKEVILAIDFKTLRLPHG